MSNYNGLEIAVIGMAGRFPMANNVQEFWENLKSGVDAVSSFTDEELEEFGVDPEDFSRKNYVNKKGSIDNFEDFDASFFGYTPSEVKLMDPQLRLLHEVCYEALEDAGYHSEVYNKPIGLYAGNASNLFWIGQLLGEMKSPAEQFEVATFNDSNTFTSRVSYKLDLRGPTVNIQTACSTSLVSIHLASQALLSGDCGMALAGGVSVVVPRKKGYLYEEGMLLSKTGACRAFDEDADGIVFGDGAGIVVLKMLEDAIRDGDNIHAVIRGSAINNDGNTKVGYTAPSARGQAMVIRTAHQVAGVDPETIHYVETHGAGSSLGDPIEFEGLKLAFQSDKKNFSAIGSVKTNVGHLNNAAGVVGFIKTVLSIKNRLILPSLHFKKSNSKIDFDNSPFYVNTELQEWKGSPLRAGVSSFGIGGTNAHVVLEEAPTYRESSGEREWKLITISADSTASLEQNIEKMSSFLNHRPNNLSDVAYTLQVGRKHYQHRKFIVCKNGQEAATIMGGSSKGESPKHRRMYSFTNKESRLANVFMFPGHGTQYLKMGKELYDSEIIFRQHLDQCFTILKKETGKDFKQIMFSSTNEDINKIENSQPAIFAFQFSLAKLLLSWEIKPKYMIGYSLGEITAACLASVFTLEDALRVVVVRSNLLTKLPEGAMLSVPLNEEQVTAILPKNISLSAVNGEACIVSGMVSDIDDFEQELRNRKILCMRVNTPIAGHSHLLEGILDEFKTTLNKIQYKTPNIPFISSVTGKEASVEEVTNPNYWVMHLRNTVRFAEGIQLLASQETSIFLEVGVGRSLTTLAERFIEPYQFPYIIDLIPEGHNEVSVQYYLLSKLGWFWAYGGDINWKSFYENEKRYRVSLPTYSFDRKRYWIDSKVSMGKFSEKYSSDRPKNSQEKWYYLPNWKSLPLNAESSIVKQDEIHWVVFTNGKDIGEKLIQELKTSQQLVTAIEIGDKFTKKKSNRFIIEPKNSEDYDKLLEDLLKSKLGNKLKIIHAWSITETLLTKEYSTIKHTLDLGFYSLLYLIQAIGRINGSNDFEITILSNHVQKTENGEPLDAAKAAILGAVPVISQEYPHVKCRSIDVVPPSTDSWKFNKLINRLLLEISAPVKDIYIAYRNGVRYVREFEKIHFDTGSGAVQLRHKGVYLITGGLGRIGLRLAEYLTRKFDAKVALVSRSKLPPKHKWDEWLTTHNNQDETSVKIRALKKLSEHGGEVQYYSSEVSDEVQMRSVIEKVEQQFGNINGVIHSAGIVGKQSFHSIKDTSKENCELQFQSKVYGLMVLEKVLQGKSLDFCMLMSSLTSVLGGLGHITYSASSNFLDAFVHEHNRTDETKWMSVNWDFWEFYGEIKNEDSSYFGKTVSRYAMTPEEGLTIFENLLSGCEQSQLLISTGDLNYRITQWVNQTELQKLNGNSFEYSRPELSSIYVAPRTELEEQIVFIWKKILGFDSIGVHDNFLELGGDSLKAVQVATAIHKELRIEILLMEFFNGPTIEKLAQYINTKRQQTPLTIIEPIKKKKYVPLSSAQKRLFVLNQFDRDSTNYNTPFAIQIEGAINIEQFEKAFNKLIDRHEILRTHFQIVDGIPMQRVLKEVEFNIEVVEADEIKIIDIVNQFVYPFQLEQAPLLRVKIVKVSNMKHYMLIDMHHMISDGVSVEIVKKEVISHYIGEDLPPPRLQYRDFVAWQQSLLESNNLKKQERYLLKQFVNVPELNLPLDYPRPEIMDYRGNRLKFILNAGLTEELNNTARRGEATLYMVLLSVFNILLSKYTSQEDIVIGSPVVGRNHPDLNEVLGIFVNTLAIRNYPSNDKNFAQFLNEVKINALKGFENQDYQFEDLVNKLDLKRVSNRNPLFDVVFVHQNIKQERLEIAEVVIEPFEIRNDTAIFDLYLQAIEDDNKIILLLDYKEALFKEETIQKLLKRFGEICEQIVQDNQISLMDIKLSQEYIDYEVSKPEITFNF